MPQLIRPSSVKIITKDGEIQVSITLDLNINLTGVEVSAQAQAVKSEAKFEPTKDDLEWAIPEFESLPKITFGKKEY